VIGNTTFFNSTWVFGSNLFEFVEKLKVKNCSAVFPHGWEGEVKGGTDPEADEDII
jgi:hypothetical protein